MGDAPTQVESQPYWEAELDGPWWGPTGELVRHPVTKDQSALLCFVSPGRPASDVTAKALSAAVEGMPEGCVPLVVSLDGCGPEVGFGACSLPVADRHGWEWARRLGVKATPTLVALNVGTGRWSYAPGAVAVLRFCGFPRGLPG